MNDINILNAYPKINIFLNVIGYNKKLKYHNLQTVVLPVKDICDYIITNSNKLSYNLSFHNSYSLGYMSNFSLKKALKHTEYHNLKNIHIIKNIPIFSGLGSVSSIKAKINNIYKKYTKSHEIWQKLGYDANILSNQERILSIGCKGNKVQEILLKEEIYCVICYPKIELSTYKVFSIITKQNYCANLITCLPELSYKDILYLCNTQGNDLSKIIYQNIPQALHSKQFMEEITNEKFYMTGSGSSHFALFNEYQKAQKIQSILSKFMWCKITKL